MIVMQVQEKPGNDIMRRVGRADQGARATLGLIGVTYAAFALSGAEPSLAAGIVAGAAGIALLVSAATRVCPLYDRIGIETS